MTSLILKAFGSHQSVVASLQSEVTVIQAAAQHLISALANGGKILLCGNGGSAGDAQHIAAELVGRFETERRGLAAIALTTDTSALTAIGNDYGYDRVFSRQLEALARPGDVLVAISTSGNSSNVVKAVELANELGVNTVGLLGGSGGKLKDMVSLPLVVPSSQTARIQECHILIGHIWCSLIDEYFVSEK